MDLPPSLGPHKIELKPLSRTHPPPPRCGRNGLIRSASHARPIRSTGPKVVPAATVQYQPPRDAKLRRVVEKWMDDADFPLPPPLPANRPKGDEEDGRSRWALSATSETRGTGFWSVREAEEEAERQRRCVEQEDVGRDGRKFLGLEFVRLAVREDSDQG
ncbi:MAG: hypothetical protein M1827_005564 [Pycnora praestabilis]|nr:MAG: hypothetical protein M1827_005564 [Pycnora praestabilis]